MRRKRVLSAALAALASISTAATCRDSGSSQKTPADDRAVPAEVELEWPDAAVMPPARARVPGDAG